MQAPRQQAMLAEGTPAIAELLERVGQTFSLEAAKAGRRKETYYDTFDWRLYRRNVALSQSGGHLVLRGFDGLVLAAAPQRARASYLIDDIHGEELREQLAAIVEMRALCPAATLQAAVQNYRILNRDRKTVARFAVHRDSSAKHDAMPLPDLVMVEEIRGYETAFEKLVQVFAAAGFSPVDHDRLIQRVYLGSPRPPLCYGSKFKVDLDPSITIGEAVAKICLLLLEDMETNEDGVLRDIDSEFLHDFRIAVRRTRSLMSLLKKVLPPEQLAHFQAEFKWLGQVTGPLRDIDVYLLEKDNYLALLPPLLRDGMQTFFEKLRGRRRQEVRALRQHLTSARYAQLKAAWRQFLSDSGSPLFEGPGNRSCRAYSDKLIARRFKGFLRHGKRIDDRSADEELHSLRIKGKKFRYLLEFFRSFYDDTNMNRFLKQMKKLQDNLGDFNDLSVQQEMLGATLTGLRGRSHKTIMYGAALGGLIAVLAKEQKRVRSRFQATFDTFSTRKNQNLLTNLITGPADDGSKKGKR